MTSPSVHHYCGTGVGSHFFGVKSCAPKRTAAACEQVQIHASHAAASIIPIDRQVKLLSTRYLKLSGTDARHLEEFIQRHGHWICGEVCVTWIPLALPGIEPNCNSSFLIASGIWVWISPVSKSLGDLHQEALAVQHLVEDAFVQLGGGGSGGLCRGCTCAALRRLAALFVGFTAGGAGSVGGEILSGHPDRRRTGAAIAWRIFQCPFAFRFLKICINSGFSSFEAVLFRSSRTSANVSDGILSINVRADVAANPARSQALFGTHSR